MLRVYSLSSGSLHPWTFGLVFSSTPPGAAVPQALLCSMLTFCWLFALVPSHFLVLCFAQSTGGGCREGSQDCSGFPQYSNNNREVNLFVLFARAGGLWLCPCSLCLWVRRARWVTEHRCVSALLLEGKQRLSPGKQPRSWLVLLQQPSPRIWKQE